MCFSYERKKKLRNFIVGLFFLLGGIEYGVIIPTLWLYLQHTFSAGESFYSVVLSSYSFASLISSPLFGAWIDYRRTTKCSIIFGLFFQIGGNFLYFVSSTKYLVLIARLLSGIGDGVGAILFAQVVRTSTVEERTAVLSLAMGARQIGGIVGPALNFGLKECNFHIGPFIVNNYRSPGILMTIIWLLVLVLVIVCYHDFVPNIESDFIESFPDGRKLNNDNSSIQKRAELPKLKQQRSSSIAATVGLWKELLNEEVIAILMAQFIMFFITCSLEALLAPMMENLLGWQETRNSVLYTLIGTEAIFVYIVVSKLSKWITDRWLMVVGLTTETAAIVLYIFVLAPAKPYDSSILPTISVGTFVIVLGLPFLGVGGVSLYSKITNERTQGFMQGVRRSFLRIATIMGTLWGGSLYRRLYLLLFVSLGLIFIAEVMMFLSFKRLKFEVKKPVYSEVTEEEKEPLLS